MSDRKRLLRRLALGEGELLADDVAELLEELAGEHLQLRNEAETVVRAWRSGCKCAGSFNKAIERLAQLTGE